MLMSLQALLTSIVDYAGLFPPAQLSLPDAIAVYDRAKVSPYAWMLNHFVIPASRLVELDQALATLAPDQQSTTSWALSVILSKDWMAELATLQAMNDLSGGNPETGMTIAAWEIAPLPPEQIFQVCQHLPSSVPAFFEIPGDAELAPYLSVLQQTNRAAKLRTGGVTAVAFPDSHQLSHRILALAAAGIPFKATAGLHHPLRGKHLLTEQPHSPVAMMHGFLNVVVLAALVYQQSLSLDEATALLETLTIAPLQFTDTAIRWHDRTLSIPEINQSRQQFFHSFGSCSFQDPITDLHTLGLL
ncbi:hypothetical protein [Pantanalinema rosaneae]|uniref:hypothetical protein n=1 Tax=Pantanalinema rosaneae TaxID=1620701 RepID=UPI003D6F3778